MHSNNIITNSKSNSGASGFRTTLVEFLLYKGQFILGNTGAIVPDFYNYKIVLINNAGTQNENDIETNLKALIKVTEKYGVQEKIRSILNIGSASGHTGSEFPEYCASKGGVIAYTKNVALRVAGYGATCNSLDPGGVFTPLNDCVVNDPQLWDEIMQQTPLKRWATTNEIAQWAYFLTVTNTFCTGQSIVVDGGESINSHFVWPKEK